MEKISIKFEKLKKFGTLMTQHEKKTNTFSLSGIYRSTALETAVSCMHPNICQVIFMKSKVKRT